MASLFQVGKCRGGIRCTSCSGYCMSQLDSELNGKRRTRTRNISDIALCIYRILHGKCLVRYLRTLRSLFRFLIQKQRVRKYRARHFIIYILWQWTFCQFFISKLSNPKIAKICRYTPRNDKEKTLHENYNLRARMWSNPVITSNFNS